MRRERRRYNEKTFCGAPRACRARTEKGAGEKEQQQQRTRDAIPNASWESGENGRGIVGASGVEERYFNRESPRRPALSPGSV